MSGKMRKFLSAAAIVAAVSLSMSQDLLAFRPIRPFKFDVSVNAAAGELNHHCVLFRDNGSFKNFENHMVADMYSDAVRNVRYSGLYSVLFEVRVASRIAVGADLSLSVVSGDVYHGLKEVKPIYTKSFAAYVMPEVRFYYLMTRLSTLSGSVELGAGFYEGCPQNVAFEYQIKPLSYTLGGKVYGKAELIFGKIFNGINFGVGYKF